MGEVALLVGAELEEAGSAARDVGEGPANEEKGGDYAVDGERRELEGGGRRKDGEGPAVGRVK